MAFIDWNSVVVGAGMAAVAHPFTYAKVLVQLGHEPLSPIMGRNLTFRRQLMYPGIFAYIKHIRRTDGYMGMYRGLLPRMCANFTTSITYQAVGHYAEPSTYIEDRKSMDAKTMLVKVWEQSTKETVARCSAVIISQPFHVIALRTMAEFVGHETLYTNIFSSAGEIYNQEGVAGFFAGLAPRIVAEVATIWLVNLLSQISNNYVLTEANELTDLRQYSSIVMGYIVQTITYPLSVTSTIMTVNGSRIQAGSEPFVPRYNTWYCCLKDLYQKGLTSRGSSMFFRKVLKHAQAATSVSPTPVALEPISVVEAVAESAEAVSDTAEKVVEVAEAVSEVAETVSDVTETVADVAGTTSEVAETVCEVAGDVSAVAETVSDVAEAISSVAETVSEVAEAVADAAEPVIEAAAPVVEAVADVAETVVEALEPVVEAAEPVVEAVAEAVPDVIEAVAPVAEAVVEAVPDIIEAVAPVAEATVESVPDIIAAVKGTVESGVEAVKDAAEPMVESVMDKVDAMKDAVVAKLETLSSVEKAVEPAAVEAVVEAVAETVVEEPAAAAVETVLEAAAESAASASTEL